MTVHITDLIPAYALDCLDKDEARQVSEHLAECELCRAELLTYQDVVGDLAQAVPQAQPPAYLKSALMARVEATTRKQVTPTNYTAWWQRLAASFRLSPAWGGVSLALILLLAASNLFLWGRVNQLVTANRQTPLRVVALAGTEHVPQAVGMVVISLDGQHGTLIVDHLPPLSKKQQYQLWLIRDGKRDNGGVFSVSAEGYGSLWVSSPQPLADYTALGITIEPAGGSPGPTGDKVLGGDI